MHTPPIALTFLIGLVLATPLAAAPDSGHDVGHGNARGGTAHAASARPAPPAAPAAAARPIGARLATSLLAQLPPGTSLAAAQAGFRNPGLFVATVRVSHQLGIPFDTLKSHLTAGATLGQTIHALRPTVDANGIARQELDRAAHDLAGN